MSRNYLLALSIFDFLLGGFLMDYYLNSTEWYSFMQLGASLFSFAAGAIMLKDYLPGEYNEISVHIGSSSSSNSTDKQEG